MSLRQKTGSNPVKTTLNLTSRIYRQEQGKDLTEEILVAFFFFEGDIISGSKHPEFQGVLLLLL